MSWFTYVVFTVVYALAGVQSSLTLSVAIAPEYYGSACHLAAQQYRDELNTLPGGEFISLDCIEGLVRE